MIWGMQIEGLASDVVARAIEAGLVLISAGPNVLRIVPPLTISMEELENGLSILEAAL
jgi:4-aminobutyrate aminotransferase-like enzyme